MTYRSSLCYETGKPRQDFALAGLLGVNYLEPVSYLYSYMQPDTDHPVTSGLVLGWPLTVFKQPQLKVALRDGQALGKVVNPMRGFMMGNPPLEATPFPGLVVREFGKGRVVYFSAPMDAIYGLYGHPDYRRLLVNAVRWAAGEAPSVEVQGPLTLECVAKKQQGGKRMVIHLLNRTAAGNARAKSSIIQEVLPIHDIVVRLTGGHQFERAMLQPSGVDLPISASTGSAGVAITVPRVDIHEIVVLE